MLLTETIKKCTSAIDRRRVAHETKQSKETYANALMQLASASERLKTTLDCAIAMKDKNLVGNSLMLAQTRDELVECANNCGMGVYDGTLSIEMVQVLKTKSESVAAQVQIVWKDAATKYSEGTNGYLSMIGGLSDDPKRAKTLSEEISKTASGALSIEAINALVDNVAEAKKITEAFSLNPVIEAFLEKVSAQQATVVDLTPDVLAWLKEKKLTYKLKLRF